VRGRAEEARLDPEAVAVLAATAVAAALTAATVALTF
jgi:hypothetical protein